MSCYSLLMFCMATLKYKGAAFTGWESQKLDRT